MQLRNSFVVFVCDESIHSIDNRENCADILKIESKEKLE